MSGKTGGELSRELGFIESILLELGPRDSAFLEALQRKAIGFANHDYKQIRVGVGYILALIGVFGWVTIL